MKSISRRIIGILFVLLGIGIVILFLLISKSSNIPYYARGSMWVPQQTSNVLLEIATNGTIINHKGSNYLYFPHGIAYDGNGNLWIANSLGNNLTKYNIATDYYKNYPIHSAFSIATGGGFVWIGGTDNHLYQVFPNNGTFIDRGVFSTSNTYNFYGIAWSPAENAVFIQLYGNGTTGYGLEIHKIYLNGTTIFDWAHEALGEWGGEGIAIGKDGFVWAILRNAKIVKINPVTPNSTTVYSGTVLFPDFLTYDGNNSIWIPSNYFPIISKINVNTGEITNYTGLANGSLGIAYDTKGAMWVPSRVENIITKMWINNGTGINYTSPFLNNSHGIAYDNYTLPYIEDA